MLFETCSENATTMKQLFLLSFILLVGSVSLFAQVRIGGGIDINIPLPQVDIRIGKPCPRPVPPPPAPVPPPKHICTHGCHHNSVGYINQQNYGGHFLHRTVSNSFIEPLGENDERVVLTFTSGEVMEMIIRTYNSHDYNYHFASYPRHSSNQLLEILLNGRPIQLHTASISLQPQQLVINIHSVQLGDFNGKSLITG